VARVSDALGLDFVQKEVNRVDVTVFDMELSRPHSVTDTGDVNDISLFRESSFKFEGRLWGGASGRVVKMDYGHIGLLVVDTCR